MKYFVQDTLADFEYDEYLFIKDEPYIYAMDDDEISYHIAKKFPDFE